MKGMRVVVFLLLLVTSFPALALPAAKKAPKKPAGPQFIRVHRDKAGTPLSLDTAVTRVVSDQGYSVELVGALHIAEKAYYQRLNKLFQGYDAVLYELIAEAEPGQRPIPLPEMGADNPLSKIQTGMGKMLGLQFQLECVDYRPRNFVHADISPEAFARSMEKRQESLANILLRVMKASQDDSTTVSEEQLNQLDLMGILMHGPSPKDQHILRLVLADSFTNLDQLNEILNGPNGSTLLHERNEHALKVLRQQVKGGRRKIAIFYGAAHMPDMLGRLLKDKHLKVAEQKWLPAWNLKDLPAGSKPADK